MQRRGRWSTGGLGASKTGKREERELEEGAKTDQKLEVLNGLNLQTVSIIF